MAIMRLRKLIPYIILMLIIAVILLMVFIPRSNSGIMSEIDEPERTAIDGEVRDSDELSDAAGGSTAEEGSAIQAEVPASTGAQATPGVITDTSKP